MISKFPKINRLGYIINGIFVNSFLLLKLNFYSEIGIDSHIYKKDWGRLHMLFT